MRPSADPLLLAGQRHDGLFRSQIERAGVRQDDANLFITAMTLRALRAYDVRGNEQSLALDALEREAGSRPDGACGFWPAPECPAWAAAVPPDADDTALILTELYRHGRISRAMALRRAILALLPCRLEATPDTILPSWIAPGCFRTWIGGMSGTRANPVDCCVNANVVALFAMLGAKQVPGYAEAVSTIAAGVAWAGSDARRLDALCPFYPAPRWLLSALDHAVECGAEELFEAASRLRRLPSELLEGRPGICRDAWGKCIWHAPALAAACAPEALLAA